MDDRRKYNIIRSITQFIKSEIKARESEGVIVGMNGGVDSSVSTLLVVKALTKKYSILMRIDRLQTGRKTSDINHKTFSMCFQK